MKRMLCMIVCLAVLLCGCAGADLTAADPRGQNGAVTEEVTEPATESVVDATVLEDPVVTLPMEPPETEGGESIVPDKTGCVRVQYSQNVSSVRYITSVEALPDNEALAAYDAAYFEKNALVVVMETVSSGSVNVGIASIENGVVTLSHELPGDVGTADMATWLLWAEVEAGLDYTWSVANPALGSNTSAY